MAWTEVLTDEQFWLGAAALVGIAATVVGTTLTNRAQRRLAEASRAEERRRRRRDELAQAYASVGQHAAQVIVYLRSDIHGDVPDMSHYETEIFLQGRVRKQSLMLHGASQDVLEAWNAFDDQVMAFAAQVEQGNKPRTNPLDEALVGLYQAFNRHLEVVYPSPENPRSLMKPPEPVKDED